jgi:type IX secretion system PorP/SprF family membrane protein
MKTFHWFILGVFLHINAAVFGQQVAVLQSDWVTPKWHNPAAYGTWYKTSVNLVAAGNLPNDVFNSRVFVLNGDHKWGEQTGLNAGGGINTYYQEVGFSRMIATSLNANVQFKLGEMRLSLGLSPGIKNLAYVNAPWDTLGSGLPPANGNQTKFSLGAGLMLYNEKFYAGFSGIQLTPGNYDELQYTDAMHFSFHTAYRQTLSANLAIFPSLQFVYDGAVMNASGQFLFYFDKPRLTAGLGYSLSTTFHLALGHYYRKFHLMYYLGFNPQSAFAANSMTHELRLSFRTPAKFGCSTCPDW